MQVASMAQPAVTIQANCRRISPRELMPKANNRVSGEPICNRVVRSTLTPLCSRKGCGLPYAMGAISKATGTFRGGLILAGVAWAGIGNAANRVAKKNPAGGDRRGRDDRRLVRRGELKLRHAGGAFREGLAVARASKTIEPACFLWQGSMREDPPNARVQEVRRQNK